MLIFEEGLRKRTSKRHLEENSEKVRKSTECNGSPQRAFQEEGDGQYCAGKS